MMHRKAALPAQLESTSKSISPLPPPFSHNTSYACHFCPVGKFQNAAGRQDCTDGIPFSTVSGANEPTTIQGLTEVVQACKSSVEQATCKVCGIDRTDQITTISNGVWVAYEGQKLMSQQNYFRFGNINDGYSEWKVTLVTARAKRNRSAVIRHSRDTTCRPLRRSRIAKCCPTPTTWKIRRRVATLAKTKLQPSICTARKYAGDANGP